MFPTRGAGSGSCGADWIAGHRTLLRFDGRELDLESGVGGGGEELVPYGYRTPILGLALPFPVAPLSFRITLTSC